MQAPFILSIDSWTISKVRATFSSIFFFDIDSFDFLMILSLNMFYEVYCEANCKML